MFHSTRKSRRHRNPQNHEDQKKPFFSKANDGQESTYASQPFFQAKLAIGQPGDKYEQEADAVADKVVNDNGQAPVLQRQAISTVQKTDLATPVEDEKLGTAEQRMEKDKLVQEKPELQMQEEEEAMQMQPEEEEESVQMKDEEEVQMQPEEEEPVQMQEEEEAVQMQEEEEEVQMQGEEEEETMQMQEEEEELQAKSNGTAAPQASSNLSGKIESSKGRGNPMPNRAKAEMENSFGADFSGVNIHTDQSSVELNKTLGAQAFTHGRDVYFNAGKFRPESIEGKRLLAHELTHVVQQGAAGEKINSASSAAPGIQREMEMDSATGRPTGNYLFRIGDDLTSGFFSRLKSRISDGTLTDDELNELRLYSIARRGSVTHAERLIMAACLDPVNIPLVTAHRRGALSIAVSTITSANRDHVANIGRESLPIGITTNLINAMQAVLGGDLTRAIALFTAANEQSTERIFEIAGERYFSQAADLVAFTEMNGLNAVQVLNAMLRSASDSTTGDQIMAGIVYATASQAGHSTASQIANGEIKVDALIPRAFAQYTGGAGADAFYSTAAITDQSKGDTVYVPTNMDVLHVAHRALIIHELTHAADDAASTGVTQTPQIDFEMRAYRRQVRYIMDQVLAADPADRAYVLSQTAAVVDGALFQWAFILEAKQDLGRYQTVVSDILTQSTSVSAANVTTALAMSDAALTTNLRNAILALPMYNATSRVVTDELTGESVLDHIN